MTYFGIKILDVSWSSKLLFFCITQSLPGRIPVRLYVRNISQDLDDFDEATAVDSWDSISYINRPVEIHKYEGIVGP